MRALVLTLCCLAPVVASAHELGLNIHLSPDVGPNLTKDAGLKWVRIDLNWNLAQPADGVPDFTAMDATVDAARAKGLSVLAVIGYTPSWASSGSSDAVTQNDVPTAGKYEAFVSLAVAHFKDRVTYFELWNEPNLGQFFEGTPQQFIDVVLKPGADAVRAQCATCKVVAPGLASLNSAAADTWLDLILKQAQDKIDVVNGHIYAGFSEDDPNVGVTSDSFLQRLENHRVLQSGGFVLYESPKSFKEVMDANGCTKPFWLTETGLEAALGDSAALDRQTRFYRHVLEKASLRGWWTTTIFYEAFDVQASPMYHFGIAQDAGSGTYTKKPVFDFLKQAATGTAFGGTTPACSDLIDNDGDGLVDFPDDPDCIDPSVASEGEVFIPDMGAHDAGGLDAGYVPGDGGTSSNGGPPGIGGGQSPPNQRGCAFDVTASSGSVVVAFLCAAFLLLRRRRA